MEVFLQLQKSLLLVSTVPLFFQSSRVRYVCHVTSGGGYYQLSSLYGKADFFDSSLILHLIMVNWSLINVLCRKVLAMSTTSQMSCHETHKRNLSC